METVDPRTMGNGVSRIAGLGGKGKYRRMDAPIAEEEEEVDEGGGGAGAMAKGMRTSESRRYVFACAVFASLNSVLLGYGEFVSVFVVNFEFFRSIFRVL